MYVVCLSLICPGNINESMHFVQPHSLIGTKVMYYRDNRGITGTITGFDSRLVHGKHVIQLDEETEGDGAGDSIKVSLKSRITEGQIVMFQDKKYKLENIMYLKNYLKLWLTNSRRSGWKPVYFNDPDKIPMSDRDPVQFSGTERSIRRDWMLKQKYAHADLEQNGYVGFMDLVIGAGYEETNGGLFIVKDVIYTQGSQLIVYYRLWEFSFL